jgi:transitional endoplasmic reticulum ATPase
MELRDEVRSSFKRAHKLAKKYYDEGDLAKARVEYVKCAQFSDRLADLTPNKKDAFKEQAKKFREMAEGLREGNIKIFTSGIKPSVPQPQPEGGGKEEDISAKVRELILAEKPNVSFKDIAGLDDVKERIKETIVYPFKNPEHYKYYDVPAGGGILLYGPPGCGKTMMAAAAAAECDAVFISIKISDIKDKYVGESEKKIKEVFKIAREYERAIIFFDEMDALAADRSDSSTGHERSLVNELLAQMDGVDTKGANKYLILAATNLPWAIDTALRRAGRFDKTIYIPEPDSTARKKLFEIYLKHKPVTKDIDLDELAERTSGFASSEIKQICEEAARIPLREAIKGKPRREISKEDFDSVISGMRTILATWYPKALKELVRGDEQEAFKELMESGKRYVTSPSIKTLKKNTIIHDPGTEQIIAGTNITDNVFKAVYSIAAEISRDGREGKSVGTSFLIGDEKNVLSKSRQLILNPFEGHKPDERQITDNELKENIKELAQLDGAFVISDDGLIEAAGRYITVDASGVKLPKGMGTRHSSTASITQVTKAVGLVVSQSGGTITIFKDGKIVTSTRP